MSNEEKQEITKAVYNSYRIMYRPECIFDLVLLHSKKLLIFGDTYKTFIESLTTPNDIRIE